MKKHIDKIDCRHGTDNNLSLLNCVDTNIKVVKEIFKEVEMKREEKQVVVHPERYRDNLHRDNLHRDNLPRVKLHWGKLSYLYMIHEYSDNLHHEKCIAFYLTNNR